MSTVGYSPLPAFSGYSGSRSPKILIIGEAWGESEAKLRKPFAGASGRELWLMLGEAMPGVDPAEHARVAGLFKYDLAWVGQRDGWLASAGIGMTNVLGFRPPGNRIEDLCGSKSEVGGETYAYPPLTLGKYLRPEYLAELYRLIIEIESTRPNIIIALGNTACWAVVRATNIGSVRGTVTSTVMPDGLSELGDFAARAEVARRVLQDSPVKVLPTYHPAGVLRQWAWRPIVVADLMKASREAEYPEIRRPRRTVLVNPTLEEVRDWTAATLRSPPAFLSPDIETGAGQIKCIGFARSRSEALIIPFVDLAHSSGSYWPTAGAELEAWGYVRTLLESEIPKVGQNFIYDLQYITRLGIRPKNLFQDTMLLHHSLFPEMQKGLGFLGSIYSNEQSWKLLRRRRPDTEKKDE